jgi:hypothetical protein
MTQDLELLVAVTLIAATAIFALAMFGRPI